MQCLKEHCIQDPVTRRNKAPYVEKQWNDSKFKLSKFFNHILISLIHLAGLQLLRSLKNYELVLVIKKHWL